MRNIFKETAEQKAARGTRCRGTHCPLKEECKRYYPDMHKSTAVSIVYFATSPFDHETERCSFFE